MKVPLTVFACYSAACRPPTSGGTGGSRGGPRPGAGQMELPLTTGGGIGPLHTSVVPRDTRPKVKPSDDHPEAPGASNTNAVRGHKGVKGDEPERRIPRLGETVDAYRDLGRGKEHKRGFPDGATMSIRHASSVPGDRVGLVVASTPGLVLDNARPAWSPAAKKAAELTGKRGVHAFIRGEVKEYADPEVLVKRVQTEPGWKKVTYYPGTEDFFDPDTRKRFTGADEGVLVNGEFYARNPKFVDQTAPVSPIERKMGLAK